MRKLFYVPLILGLAIGCSHQPKSEKRITYFGSHTFGVERTPTSENSCLDYLKPFLKIHGASATDTSSAKIWHDLNTSIMEEFSNKLQSKGPPTYDLIYKENMPHVQVLEKVFKIKSGEKPVQNVGTIISDYSKYMKDLINKNIVKKEDVLLPAFVFRTTDGINIWKQFGEELPEGAVLEGNVLTSEVFNSMVKEGFFPIGSAELTTTGISAFEHDLAHFTGFIDSPEYMRAVKKLALTDQSKLTDNQIKRGYFFNEGMVSIKDDKSLMNTLKLSDEMKKNPSQVTLDEMVKYLQGFSTEELEVTRKELSANLNKYYSMLGGAGRDPVSQRNNVFHDMIKSALPRISRYVEKDDGDMMAVASQEGLASFQLILLRLRDIKFDDWVYATTHTVQKDSPVYKLFIDKRMWEDADGPMPGLGGEFVEMRNVFLNDEIGLMVN